jgi:hypothetical protein
MSLRNNSILKESGHKALWIAITTIWLTSCSKFLHVPDPNNQLLTSDVFSNDNSASSAIAGIYSDLMTSSNLRGNITILAGMSADELIPTNSFATQSYIQFESNSLQVNNPDVSTTWSSIYPYIYDANACLQGIAASSGMSQSVKNQLTGEAKFIRAFCNFYLTNIFGPVPLILSTDYRVNSQLPQTPMQAVYKQIELDLKDAMQLLSGDYNFSNGEKTRPTRWAAIALLARVYLYEQNWEGASAMADTVISSNQYSLNPDLNAIFLMNSDEAIWQLFPVIPGIDTHEGNLFIPFDNTTIPNFLLAGSLLNSFENGDNRKSAWIDSTFVNGQTYYYPYKYKVSGGDMMTEYYMVLRFAEQYLIRAEALAHLNQITASVTDVNVIRERAGLQSLPVNITADSCLAAISHERQIEFMAEFGHRWFDLKRTATADAILGPLKNGNWQPYDTLWPIPLSQLNANPFLTQNSGYK